MREHFFQWGKESWPAEQGKYYRDLKVISSKKGEVKGKNNILGQKGSKWHFSRKFALELGSHGATSIGDGRSYRLWMMPTPSIAKADRWEEESESFK